MSMCGISTYGLKTGDSIYIVAYSDNSVANNNPSYRSNSVGTAIFPCLNPAPSNVVKVIIR